jgi:membrane-associated phospholipid phosphatase
MVVALAVGLLVVTLAVAVDHGSAAAHVDLPVERWVTARRTSGWTAFFRGATHIGDPGTAFVGGLVLSAFAAVRSARVALVIVLLTLVRPLFSSAFKDAVGRPRPQLSQLIAAGGDAFPSGHALAACVFWGALPAVVALWTPSRGAVRAAVTVAGVLVFVVACSRVYLGVHWLTDVLGGALLGLLLLVPLYRVLAARVPTMDT